MAVSDQLPTATVGQLQVDLSVDRSNPEDYQLLRLPTARFISFVDVPDEAYLHFGSQESPAIDARQFEGGTISRPQAIKEGIGAVYVENPAGSGTMTITAGVDVETAPQPDIGDIDTIGSIDSTVDVTDVGDFDINTLPNVTIGTWSAGVLPGLDNEVNLAYGEQLVSSAGTSEALNGGGSQTVPDNLAVLIQGVVSSSDDQVYVGDNTVSSSDGYPLSDGQTVSLKVTDVSNIEVDADTANDGVRWIVEVA